MVYDFYLFQGHGGVDVGACANGYKELDIAYDVAEGVYNLLKNKNHHLGVILATILVPIVNTFIFIIGSLIFFNGVFGQLISLFIAANFIIEFVINLLLSPSIYYIVNLFKKRKA